VLPEVGVLGPPPEESGRRTNLAFRKLKVLAWAAVRGVVGVVVAGGATVSRPGLRPLSIAVLQIISKVDPPSLVVELGQVLFVIAAWISVGETPLLMASWMLL